jgi:hypothetical protein
MRSGYHEPPNQVDYDLLVAPQNQPGDEDGIGHALRSSGLLRLEASRERVSQLGLKTSVGVARMCMWHHNGGCVELKLKTNGSIRRAVSDPATLLCRFYCIRL